MSTLMSLRGAKRRSNFDEKRAMAARLLRRFIPSALNIDAWLTPTSPVLSAPRGGEGRGGGVRISSPPPGAERPGEVGARKSQTFEPLVLLLATTWVWRH